MANKNSVANRRTMHSPSRSSYNEHEDRRHFNPGRPNAPRRPDGTFAPTTNQSGSRSKSRTDEDQDTNKRTRRSAQSTQDRSGTDRRNFNPGRPNAPHRADGNFAPNSGTYTQYPSDYVPRKNNHAKSSKQSPYDTEEDYAKEESEYKQDEYSDEDSY